MSNSPISRRTAARTACGSSSWCPTGSPGPGSGVGARRTRTTVRRSRSRTAPLKVLVPRSRPRKRIAGPIVVCWVGRNPVVRRSPWPRPGPTSRRRVAGHLRDAPPVDPGGRQGAPGPLPWLNHAWHGPLYLTARGLTTGPSRTGPPRSRSTSTSSTTPCGRTSDGGRRQLRLAPRPVADFYHDLIAALDDLGVTVRIHTTRSRSRPDPVRPGHTHASYDRPPPALLAVALSQADRC